MAPHLGFVATAATKDSAKRDAALRPVREKLCLGNHINPGEK